MKVWVYAERKEEKYRPWRILGIGTRQPDD